MRPWLEEVIPVSSLVIYGSRFRQRREDRRGNRQGPAVGRRRATGIGGRGTGGAPGGRPRRARRTNRGTRDDRTGPPVLRAAGTGRAAGQGCGRVRYPPSPPSLDLRLSSAAAGIERTDSGRVPGRASARESGSAAIRPSPVSRPGGRRALEARVVEELDPRVAPADQPGALDSFSTLLSDGRRSPSMPGKGSLGQRDDALDGLVQQKPRNLFREGLSEQLDDPLLAPREPGGDAPTASGGRAPDAPR